MRFPSQSLFAALAFAALPFFANAQEAQPTRAGLKKQAVARAQEQSRAFRGEEEFLGYPAVVRRKFQLKLSLFTSHCRYRGMNAVDTGILCSYDYFPVNETDVFYQENGTEYNAGSDSAVIDGLWIGWLTRPNGVTFSINCYDGCRSISMSKAQGALAKYFRDFGLEGSELSTVVHTVQNYY